MDRIAYLAPEIPALSATFVYNEIIALQEKGYKITSISVHEPSVAALEHRVAALQTETHYLYREGLLSFFAANVYLLLTDPSKYSQTLCKVLRDIVLVGVCNRRGLGLVYRFLAACRTACILKKEKCRHIHAHFAHIPTDIAMYAAALAGIPFSFTAHANDLFERGWLLHEKIARSKFAATISEYNREFMASQGGNQDKIHIIRCGVDSTRFPSRVPKPPSTPYKIGVIGRMVEKKGFSTLIHAAALLQERGLDFCLIIAGGGPLDCDLRQASERLGISDKVDFLGPMVNEKVPSWLRSLDLFVLPCQKDSNGDMDGIPVVLMEAMASGIPVISTRISGIPELISHEKDGLLIEPQSPETLAGAITQLIFDGELRSSLQINGPEKIRNEFDAELNIQRLAALFIA